MKIDHKIPDIFFMLGEGHDSFLMQGMEKIKTVNTLLNKKMFRVADTPLTYRQVNSLDTNGVLKDDRESKKNWRGFSLKELIYLSTIKELKKYGVSDKQLEKLKKSFFSKEYSFDTDECIQFVFHGTKIILVFKDNGNIAFYNIPSYNLFEMRTKSLININFNEIVLDIWKMVGKKRIEYKDELTLMADIIDDFDTSEKEASLLKIIRDKNYKAINIKKNNDEEFIVKGEATKIIKEKQLLEMLEEKDFADVNILKRDGNIVNIKVEEMFKI